MTCGPCSGVDREEGEDTLTGRPEGKGAIEEIGSHVPAGNGSSRPAAVGPSVPAVGSSVRVTRARRVHRALLISDAASLGIAFTLAWGVVGPGISARAAAVFLAMLPAWWLGAQLYRLYDADVERADRSTVEDFVGVLHLVTLGVWLTYAAAHVTGNHPSASRFLTFWAAAIPLVMMGRFCTHAFARRRHAYLQKAVIVGAGDVGQLVGRKFLQNPEFGINLVGFVDGEPKPLRNEVAQVPLLGSSSRLAEIVHENEIDRVVIAFSSDRHEQLLQTISSLVPLGVQIDIVPRLFEAVGQESNVHTVEGLPVLTLARRQSSRLSVTLKRLIDVVGGALILLVMAPVLAAIALAIKLDSPGPVFFRQVRLGMGMREFTMLKFRTMRSGTGDEAHRAYLRKIMDVKAAPLPTNHLYKLDRSAEVTRVGRLLRRFSLDELPQLVNVIRGEMSLVGPRPCIPYETELFESQHFERFAVPAGMTGLWQVSTRARSTFREALDLDVQYVRSWSLRLDLGLILRTPSRVFRKDGTA
jgi:exopolysaccharide biosynthesis polyprenyl glycosylphosphotransferase